MSNSFKVEAKDFQKLKETMSKFPERAEDAINKVLHVEGAQLIENNIAPLIHPSGRKWKKKPKSATAVNPFMETKSNLAVTIHSKKAYQYLYFPDDGSNTKLHAGEQHFMKRGAEEASGEIIDMCIKEITKKF